MGISVGVVGVSGYSGGELLRLLAGHPTFEVTTLFGQRTAGSTVADQHPNLVSLADRSIEPFTPEAAAHLDLVFLCLPAGQSPPVVAELPDETVVIDLSGDHRLPPDVYRQWYGKEPDRTSPWLYGLTERCRPELPGATRIANPGCYPTPAVLALAPLLDAGLIERRDIVIDAISGISGAGAQESLAYSFSELVEDAVAYKVGVHQHTPEIEQALGAPVTFTSHLVPMARGIVATCSAPLVDGDPAAVAAEAYGTSPFIRIFEAPPHTKQVRGSNLCALHYVVIERTRRVVAIGVIDNMVKGAAGQAVQNANLALGLEETAGLPLDGMWL